MPKFKVIITETLAKEIEVEAEDLDEARVFVEGAYRRGDIILYSDDYVGTEFEAYEMVSERTKDEKIRKDYSR